MKNNKKFIGIGLILLLANTGLYSQEGQRPKVVTINAKESEKLSADEMAFVAKLTDQNRKSFVEKLSADQRKSVFTAVANGAQPDEAVQRMVEAKVIRERGMIVQAEPSDPKIGS